MIKKVVLALGISFAVLFLSDLSIAQNMKEGLWEITVKMEMEEGMPITMPAQTVRQCIKKEEPIPELKLKSEGSDDNCKFTLKQIKGDTVSWKAECRDKEGVTTITGRITYKGTTFDGMQEIKEDGDLLMKSKISGKWIGQCK